VVFDTKDGGIAGDHWRVTIQAKSGQTLSGSCGDGSTGHYSGPLSVLLTPGTYKVSVSLCSGVCVFPAGGKLRART
jgi:hypothetical protein